MLEFFGDDFRHIRPVAIAIDGFRTQFAAAPGKGRGEVLFQVKVFYTATGKALDLRERQVPAVADRRVAVADLLL
jgi:hypothetical protein